MRKATKLSQIVELTSSSCLLMLVSYTVVLAQNDITIKFGYKYRVQDKLYNGLCPVQICSLVTEIRVVLSERDSLFSQWFMWQLRHLLNIHK